MLAKKKLRACANAPQDPAGACTHVCAFTGGAVFAVVLTVVCLGCGLQGDGEATGVEHKIRITLTTSKSVANLEKVSAT
jgi:hypothetical protein